MEKGLRIIVINHSNGRVDKIRVSDASVQIVCGKNSTKDVEYEDCQVLLKYWGYRLNDCSFTFLRNGERIHEIFH